MKKLTGRAAEDFINKSRLTDDYFESMPETCQNALIIEWLDTVGIYISVKKVISEYWMYDILGHNISVFELIQQTRTEATNAGIAKANELYNLNN